MRSDLAGAELDPIPAPRAYGFVVPGERPLAPWGPSRAPAPRIAAPVRYAHPLALGPVVDQMSRKLCGHLPVARAAQGSAVVYFVRTAERERHDVIRLPHRLPWLKSETAQPSVERARDGHRILFAHVELCCTEIGTEQRYAIKPAGCAHPRIPTEYFFPEVLPG